MKSVFNNDVASNPLTVYSTVPKTTLVKTTNVTFCRMLLVINRYTKDQAVRKALRTIVCGLFRVRKECRYDPLESLMYYNLCGSYESREFDYSLWDRLTTIIQQHYIFLGVDSVLRSDETALDLATQWLDNHQPHVTYSVTIPHLHPTNTPYMGPV